MKVNMDQATAERLADMLDEQAGTDPGLLDVRRKIRTALEPTQFGAKLTRDELQALIDLVDGGDLTPEDRRQALTLVRRQAVPKLRTMLERST